MNCERQESYEASLAGFVAGAIFSGMAMVLTLMLVARKTMRLEDYITQRHIDVIQLERLLHEFLDSCARG